MTDKEKTLSIPISAFWKTPLGWIFVLGLASFLGLGGAGIMAGNGRGDEVRFKVRENVIRIDRIEKDIDEIKSLCRDINKKLDDMRGGK